MRINVEYLINAKRDKTQQQKKVTETEPSVQRGL